MSKEQEQLYIKVDSKEFFDRFYNTVVHEMDTILREYGDEGIKKWFEITANEVPLYIKILIQPYTSMTGILFPSIGADKVFLDRVTQIISNAENLIVDVQNEFTAILSEIKEEKELTTEERQKIVKNLVRLLKTILLTGISLKEATNRLLTFMSINTNSDVRPPLINVILGYDKL